jgi:hypothetical protein
MTKIPMTKADHVGAAPVVQSAIHNPQIREAKK